MVLYFLYSGDLMINDSKLFQDKSEMKGGFMY